MSAYVFEKIMWMGQNRMKDQRDDLVSKVLAV